MKIVRNDVRVVKFSDVTVGSVFIESDVVFMKTPEFYEIEGDGYEEARYNYNAIDLSNGEFAHLVSNDMVKVCNDAHLVVN